MRYRELERTTAALLRAVNRRLPWGRHMRSAKSVAKAVDLILHQKPSEQLRLGSRGFPEEWCDGHIQIMRETSHNITIWVATPEGSTKVFCSRSGISFFGRQAPEATVHRPGIWIEHLEALAQAAREKEKARRRERKMERLREKKAAFSRVDYRGAFSKGTKTPEEEAETRPQQAENTNGNNNKTRPRAL